MPAHPTCFARLALTALLIAVSADRAAATLQFQKVFLREHIADHPNREFAEFVGRKAKCNICHQGCKDRTKHNRYGAELAKLLDHEADKYNVEKTVAALRAVAEMRAEKSEAEGPTFGALIQAGKLPAGELEELKREPAN